MWWLATELLPVTHAGTRSRALSFINGIVPVHPPAAHIETFNPYYPLLGTIDVALETPPSQAKPRPKVAQRLRFNSIQKNQICSQIWLDLPDLVKYLRCLYLFKSFASNKRVHTYLTTPDPRSTISTLTVGEAADLAALICCTVWHAGLVRPRTFFLPLARAPRPVRATPHFYWPSRNG
jgi:hypothetical protein